MSFISGPFVQGGWESWEEADRQLRAEAAATRSAKKESKPMGTKLTLTPELRERLGLGETPTALETLKAINRELEKPTRRERLAASDRAGSTTEDALYDEIYPSPRALSTDPTEGLSAADAAAYRAVWGEA